MNHMDLMACKAMGESMLIYVIPSWYKTEKNPENCIFIYEQIRELKKLGHQIVVLSPQQLSIQSRQKVNNEILKVDDAGIATYYTEFYSVWPSKFRKIYLRSFSRKLEVLYKQAVCDYGEPDLLYAHFSFAAGYAASQMNTGHPLVVEEHFSYLMKKNIDNGLKKCLIDTVKSADKFICVSDGLKQMIEKHIGEFDNIITIPNMINPCFKYYKKIDNNSFVFFSLGSLIPRKGFKELIEAFSEEFKRDKEIELIIGGSGEEKGILETLIAEKGMTGRITLAGQLTREESLEYFINCNAFVLASKAETYGLVYREALAVGRPIISTRHGGFDSDWDESYGILIDVDNPRQLRTALREIYVNYSHYNGELISTKCLQSCGPSSVAAQLESVFKSVIKTQEISNCVI